MCDGGQGMTVGDARSRLFTMNAIREWNGQMQDLKPVESGQEEGADVF